MILPPIVVETVLVVRLRRCLADMVLKMVGPNQALIRGVHGAGLGQFSF